MMEEKKIRRVITEDGMLYEGEAFGGDGERVLELVFNTSMTGYQEILSDPSYTDQAVVMTYPLIGNYGMAPEDYESMPPRMGALIVREYNDEPSNFRSMETLGAAMKRFGIPGVQGIDTRALVRRIRDLGSMKVLITDCMITAQEGRAFLAKTQLPRDEVRQVSTKTMRIAPAFPARLRIAAIDCGMKENIIRSFNTRGVTVYALPYTAGPEEILSLAPDGLFISNGPGDPEDVPETIGTVRALIGRLPIFGICLGHQILSLAYGAKTYKLKFGHRGGNHPVKELATGKVTMTAQNHSYAVSLDGLAETGLTVTHMNLLDHTVEGVQCAADRAFSVQYHPEAGPGPHDGEALFDRFVHLMEEAAAERKAEHA